VRLLSPLPDVPSRIEPLGAVRPAHPCSRPTWSAFVASFCPVRDLQPDERPSSWLAASEIGDGDALGLGVEAATAETADPGVAVSAVQTAAATRPRLEGTTASPSGPQRYKVQFTASEEYVALVEEAKELLAHALPRADVVEIHLRALRTFVAVLKQRKYAQLAGGPKHTVQRLDGGTSASSLGDSIAVIRSERTTDSSAVPLPWTLDKSTVSHTEAPSAHPRRPSDEVPFSDELPQSGALTESPRRRGRHVPAAVRRAVCERDGHRCAYIDARGVRCRETSRLELHHREPFARGGPSTAENLSLHCAAHNALAAEQDFGHASAIARRDYPHFTERTLLCEAQRE